MQEETNINIANNGHKKSNGAKTALFVTLIAVAVMVSALLTFSLTVKYFFGAQSGADSFYKKFEIISKYIGNNAYYDADYDAMEDAALKAYASSAGDRYTVYYNAEDFKALNEDNEGRYVGIGVTVSVSEIEYLGEILSLVEVIKVHDNSPAQDKGIVSGDLIYSVYTENGELFADDVGMEVLSSQIKGEEGTPVTISVLREQGDSYEKLELTLERRKVDVKSVEYSVYEQNSNVGIVTISQFDLKTPELFKNALSALLESGIEKIVIDMRNNGGGDLNSVVACASYFLEEDDLIISAENNKGDVVKYKVRPRNYGGSYASCSVLQEDIGKFKETKAVILVNENTASAAELLTAVFRDYKLAPIVGVNTFGKGTMQTIYSLEEYGIEGGIKVTTDVYFPPCGENYDGVGISPDIVVELEDNGEDNQLQAAVNELIK